MTTWAAMLVVCRGISLGGPGSGATDSLDLTVSGGDVCTIVGPSGSGKSRLCQLLTGIRQPVRGVITVDGRNTAEHPRSVRSRVTHVVPAAPLWPALSTISNVEYVLRLCGVSPPTREDMVGALRLAELPDRLFGSPTEALSHFQRYGVWLAIHRLRNVPVLILDDPFLELAGWQMENLARLVRESTDGGRCAVITSGSADVPAAVAAHRYRIARGQLMPIETPTSWIDDADLKQLLPSDQVS